MTWNGRKPPCYEYKPELHTYVFHVTEKESIKVSALANWTLNMFANTRAPLVRLLTGVSCLEMLKDPSRWARFYGTKSAKDHSEDQ